MKKTFIYIIFILLLAFFFKSSKNMDYFSHKSDSIINIVSLPDLEDTLSELLCYHIETCSDGSFIVTISPNIQNSTYYFLYKPDLSKHSYDFFPGFKWSENIKVSITQGHKYVEIPVYLYNSDSPIFLLQGKYQPDNNWKLSDRTIIFLKEEDKLFHKMYSSLEEKQREEYRENLKFSDDISYEEQIKILKNAFYCGDYAKLKAIFEIEKANHLSNDTYEFAIKKDFNLTEFKENTPASFPFPEILSMFAKAVGNYETIISGSKEVESNTDYKRLLTLPNAHDFFLDYQLEEENPSLWGAYELDFDNDGLHELIYFYPGGTMGNEFWDIIHLDQSGAITSVHSGEAFRSFTMYQYDDNYFFLNQEYDYYDKRNLGVNIFAMAKDGKMWKGSVCREIIGAEIVFTDIFDKNIMPLTTDIETKFQEYILEYKKYESTKFQNEWKPNQVIIDKINKLATTNVDTFYSFDVNNDGTDDVLAESIYYPGSAHQVYLYNLIFYDYKTNQAIDLSQKLVCGGSYDYSQRIFPILFEGKNYFLNMQNAGSSYIFKLQEIIGTTPKLLAGWFVTPIEQVTVSQQLYQSPN